jgi:hypothetical protein
LPIGSDVGFGAGFIIVAVSFTTLLVAMRARACRAPELASRAVTYGA